MAKLLNGINGPIVGKVGTVVGSSWKGIPYIKARYRRRTKKAGEKEQDNRRKFAMAQKWLRPLLSFVRQGFNGYSQKSEGFVAAKSYLLKNAVEGEGENMKINPAKVQVAWGDLPLPESLAMNVIQPYQIEITWDKKSSDDELKYDQVMWLAYNIEPHYTNYVLFGQFRHTGRDVVYIPEANGLTWHIYVAFIAADRSRQSHSVYMGVVNT